MAGVTDSDRFDDGVGAGPPGLSAGPGPTRSRGVQLQSARAARALVHPTSVLDGGTVETILLS